MMLGKNINVLHIEDDISHNTLALWPEWLKELSHFQ